MIAPIVQIAHPVSLPSTPANSMAGSRTGAPAIADVQRARERDVEPAMGMLSTFRALLEEFVQHKMQLLIRQPPRAEFTTSSTGRRIVAAPAPDSPDSHQG